VVASNVGGIPEYARLLPHARLVDAHDPARLHAVFNELREELRAAGRDRVATAQREAVREHFSDANFDVQDHVYRKLFADAEKALT